MQVPTPYLCPICAEPFPGESPRTEHVRKAHKIAYSPTAGISATMAAGFRFIESHKPIQPTG